MIKFTNELSFAKKLDKKDKLRGFKKSFHFPKSKGAKKALYFTGNSLGLCPKSTKDYINEEIKAWQEIGVEGHFKKKFPWLSYHEFAIQGLSHVVGAKPSEVVAMGSLSSNIHYLFFSFYRPTSKKFKILMEKDAFPSDHYIVQSQIKYHGFDPEKSIVYIGGDQKIVSKEEILSKIDQHKDELALIFLGHVNYLTGQAFPIVDIAQKARAHQITFGLDLAHGVGNVILNLHELHIDFAAWCSYKYLNAGPGAIAGIFVHEKHHQSDLPKLTGWWGHNKATRFSMPLKFQAIPTAESWQHSNPNIFSIAALRASLDLFQKAKIVNLRKKSQVLTSYLEFLLKENLGNHISIITSRNVAERGAQLSIRLNKEIVDFEKKLQRQNIFLDFRKPNIIRISPAPLYTSFEDVFLLVKKLKGILCE